MSTHSPFSGVGNSLDVVLINAVAIGSRTWRSKCPPNP